MSDLSADSRRRLRRTVRRLTSAATFFLVAGGTLAACGRSRDPGEIVAERRRTAEAVVNLGAEPSTLDPARATRLADLRVIGQLLEGLVRVAPDGRIEPAAAESWTVSPDGRTYTFRLRPARWSNGDPVRAGDFAYAWRRVLDPDTNAYWVALLFPIDGARRYYEAKGDAGTTVPPGIEVPDERTLVVRLERPLPYFLSLVALEAYFPVHPPTVETNGDDAFRAPGYVGNGPFVLREHIPRQRIVLTPNPDYYARESVGLDRLVMTMVENEFTEWVAYRRGELDVTEGLHRSALSQMHGQPDFRSVPLVGTCYLAFNCARPPFDRPEVRRALARSIDRAQLVEYITRSGERPATAFVPPGIPEFAGGQDFRAEGGALISPLLCAVDELATFREAVQPLDAEPVYSYDATELQQSLAVGMQMMWRQNLGIEVDIQSHPARILAQNKRNGDYGIARASWVADYLDPMTFLAVFRSDGPNNTTGWANAEYDALLDRADAETDPAQRAARLHEAERLLIEEMPICPIYFYSIAYLQRPGLAGVERNALGRIDFSRARWEER